MRNLTIKRKKTFVASLGKLKIYIEDPNASEITVDNIPCRKLGEIKNGEEETFQIEENSVKVFAIFDKLSKNYCNEFYQLPEGQDDIVLSGKCKYNPANGNAFRFDGNDCEEVIANRKRNTKKGLVVLIVAIIVGSIVGYLLTGNLFSNDKASEKTFSASGMSITLTDEFTQSEFEGYTATYGSENVAVIALKEDYSLMEELRDYTIKEYIELVVQASNLTSVQIKTAGELTYFEYEATNPSTEDTYRYFSYVYKTNDSFWLIQFATLSEDADKYDNQIAEWAKSVKFAD